jgi:hypothetical protein
MRRGDHAERRHPISPLLGWPRLRCSREGREGKEERLLERRKPLKRTGIKQGQPRRYWGDAHEKIRRDYRCRGCGRGPGEDGLQDCLYDVGGPWERIERAHIVPRRYDRVEIGPRGGKRVYVEPDAICPLCSSCHRAFDAGELSLLGKLTMSELRHAVRVLGKERARHRISGKFASGCTSVREET